MSRVGGGKEIWEDFRETTLQSTPHQCPRFHPKNRAAIITQSHIRPTSYYDVHWATDCCLSSGSTFHPIHLSIGVSRSASRDDLSSAGAENASFIPSKSPFNCMELVAGEFLEWKLGAKASAFMSEIAATVPIIDFIVSRCVESCFCEWDCWSIV